MNKNVAVAIALVVVFIAGVAGYLVTTGTREAPESVAPAPVGSALACTDEGCCDC